MELFKNIYFAGAIIGFCVVVFYFANTGSVFGKFVNRFLSCQQNPANSFPCFGQYDILVMLIAMVVGIIFFAILVFDVFKLLRP